MFDDQDGCEWVNVSSGTGLPYTTPGQKAVKRLCVCVCVGGGSCYIDLYCTIPSYRPTGFVTRDDVTMPSCKSCSSVFCDFSYDDIFFSSAFSFSDITTTIALCMIYRSADSTMTSPLLCYLSVS